MSIVTEFEAREFIAETLSMYGKLENTDVESLMGELNDELGHWDFSVKSDAVLLNQAKDHVWEN